MTDDLIRVHTETLRGCADGLAGTGHRLGQGLGAEPGLVVPAPGWAAAGALAGLESAVHGWLCAVGGRAAETSAGLRSAADGYEAADDRAARRVAGAGQPR